MMHLLNARTFVLETFPDTVNRPRYAILSHTWAEDEVTYQDIAQIEDARQKAGFVKIQHTCEQAIEHGLTHVWVDTCCIDKSSSAELSEAINSMFAWYEQSNVCYVYLADVQVESQEPEADLDMLTQCEQSSSAARSLASSRWFTRGWTLQELLAPDLVAFYDRRWKLLGDLGSMVDLVSHVTNIPSRVLNKRARVASFSIAQRMSWTANRNTTRLEDRAYSLLGLFNINMPLLYGEGSRAFQRLQEEIIRATTDHSFLLWGLSVDYDPSGKYRKPIPTYESTYNGTAVTFSIVNNVVKTPSIFASSPSDFASCGNIAQLSANVNDPSQATYSLTNYGLQMKLPILRMDDSGLSAIAILSCYDELDMVAPVCLVLEPVESRSKHDSDTFVRGSRINTTRSIAELGKAALESIIILREAPILDFRLNVRYFDCRKQNSDSTTERRRFHVGSVSDTPGWNPKGVNFFGQGQHGTSFDLRIEQDWGFIEPVRVSVSDIRSHGNTPCQIRFYRTFECGNPEFEYVESPWDTCLRLDSRTCLAAQTVVNSPLVLLKLFLIDDPGSSWAKATADTFPSFSAGRNREQRKQMSQSSMFAKLDPREMDLDEWSWQQI